MNGNEHAPGAAPPAGWRSLFTGIGQACLLIAVAALPAWSNPYSGYSFESDKSWLLILLAVAGLAASIIGCAIPLRDARTRPRSRASWPTALALLALIVLTVLTASASIQPAWAWWGSPHRAWGGWLQLALIAMAGIVALAFRSSESRRRLAQVIILSSIPVVLFGIWQGLTGPTLMLWDIGQTTRPTSTLANPLFLGSYLMLAGAFTAVELIHQWQGRRGAGRRGVMAVAALGIVLLLQGLILIWTHSRGAWLGVAGGVLFAAFAGCLRRGRVLAAILIASSLLALLVSIPTLIVLVQTDTPVGHAPIGHVFDPTGSGRQRLEIWSQLGEYLLEGHIPLSRWIIGHGHDTQGLILPNQLAYRSAPATLLDRAHNAWLDGLLSVGIGGLLLRMILFLAATQAGLRQIGLTVSLPRLLIGAMAGMLAMGLAAQPWSIGFSLTPVAIGLGGCAGLVAAIALGARRHGACDAPAADVALTLAALGMIFGRWIDLQFGFETQAAGLLTWVALGVLAVPPDEPARPVSDPDHRHSNPGQIVAAASGAILTGLLLGSGMQAGRESLHSIGATWLVCGILCGLWAGKRGQAAYPILSLGPMLVAWMVARLAGMLLDDHGVWIAVATTAAAFVGIALCVYLAIDAPGPRRRAASRRALCVGVVCAPGAALVAGLIVGDLATQHASQMALIGRLDDARSSVQVAIRWGPHDAPAYDILAQIELAENDFGRAARAMEHAWRASPFQTEYGRRQARIYRTWADQVTTLAERQALLGQAVDALGAAQAWAPADPYIAQELDETRRLLAGGETP
jgi:hypothetical protein